MSFNQEAHIIYYYHSRCCLVYFEGSITINFSPSQLLEFPSLIIFEAPSKSKTMFSSAFATEVAFHFLPKNMSLWKFQQQQKRQKTKTANWSLSQSPFRAYGGEFKQNAKRSYTIEPCHWSILPPHLLAKAITLTPGHSLKK